MIFLSDNQLPKKTLLLWQIRTVILGIFIQAALNYFLHFLDVYRWIAIGIAVLMVVICFFYLPCYLRNYRITVKNGGIVINCGVIIKTSHIMPFSRMIYAQTLATPLARLFGLSALLLKAARSYVVIPEMYANEAADFVEQLAKEEMP